MIRPYRLLTGGEIHGKGRLAPGAPPWLPGVYLCEDARGAVIYVGQTGNWWKRRGEQGANLSGADMDRADLTGADISGANLDGVIDLDEGALPIVARRWCERCGSELAEHSTGRG